MMPGPDDLEDDDATLPEDEVEGSDAGQSDDESGDETETGQELEDAQGEERVGGRAERRIQTLRREAQEASERAARFERELQAERARYQQPQQPQGESPEAEAARLALMTLEERMEYRLRKADEQHRLQMNIMQFRTADMADKAAYEAKASIDPRYKKYRDRVEQLLSESRKQGRDFDRETVFKFALGEAVLNSKNKPQQQARGQENIRRQQAIADSGRGDVSNARQRAGSTNSLADLERRLAGKFI